MRWQGGRESENVEDDRGMAPAGIAIGGVGTLVILVLGLLFGADPAKLLQQVQQAQQQQAPAGDQAAPVDDEISKFIRVVLADTEDVWTDVFREMGKTYRDPKLKLFSGQVDSACGMADAAVGPFYCPGDEKVYLDVSFFDELRDRFQAPGEFAEAYVIAHEIGHHVQKQLGITDKVDAMRARMSKTEYNKVSVRLELQADFYAGVWANRAQKMRNILEEGDIESALRAASAIGDDRLEKQAQGYVVPDSFTHGTSEQRVRWFTKGFKTGDVNQGDTFNAREL
jgi:hypothetical protein